MAVIGSIIRKRGHSRTETLTEMHVVNASNGFVWMCGWDVVELALRTVGHSHYGIMDDTTLTAVLASAPVGVKDSGPTEGRHGRGAADRPPAPH